MNQILQNYEENGFVVLKNFISNNQFDIICEKLNKNIEIELNKIDKKKLAGSLMGNLSMQPGNHTKEIFDLLIENNINRIIETLSKNKISDFDVYVSGNINFQFKYNQHFHTDGNFENNYLIVNIATENITELNGPLEISPGTHKQELPYWKFLLKKKEKEKVLLSKGDILIRNSAAWHRGTINISKKPRFLLGYILKNKKEKIPKFDFDKNSKFKIGQNIFDRSIIGKIEENLYTRFSYLYLVIRLIKSFFKKNHKTLDDKNF